MTLYGINFMKNALDDFSPKLMPWPNTLLLGVDWNFLVVRSLDDLKRIRDVD